ncbi:condensation domain-containing protein [Streptomyces fagopyri]|uniref:condensation domain-containing protein n=1 Tax=Streptomyces fagopyri TaxID=2662397 RepID=UPI0036BE313B
MTAQEDFAVGVPVARHGSSVLQNALTCLIDTVCVRLRFTATDDMQGLIDHVRVAAGEALAAADVPFTEVVDLVNPPRNGESNPLYQAMFSLHEQPPELGLSGCTALLRRPEAARATCDLVTGVWPDGDGGCSVRLAYRQDRVPRTGALAVGETLAGILRRGPAVERRCLAERLPSQPAAG